MVKRAQLFAIPAILVAASSGCSLLLDWNDFSGGTDASSADAHGVDGPTESAPDEDAPGDDAPFECTGTMACVPGPPSGWSGPVAVYAAPTVQGAPPACGAGFAATPAFDGNAGPDAGAPTCSACACGDVSGESCAGPVMTFYDDTACTTEVPPPDDPTLEVTTSCQTSAVLCQATTIAAPLPTGGTCAPGGGVATIPPVVWTDVARACSPATAPTSGGCTGGDVCMPAPASPFVTCVMQSGAATSCPAAYPTGPQIYYSGVDDQRGCSACQCTAPAGGTCTLAANAISICGLSTTYSAPGACTAFECPDVVKLTASPVLVDAGACAVSGGGVPGGSATPSGATSFCCTP